ncbi:MAG TPA: phospholipase D-like domain-containing protein [Thermoanaerobaculia bacterium]|jgi:cardiolipin synthase|nr:phospholipase D-like domain-containing protein [Thermoanaerobaculia bacterium]
MAAGSQRRTWRGLLLAGCAAVALLGQGCTLISLKRSVYQFDHPFAVADSAFRRSLDTFGNTMVGGNHAEILNNGDEIFSAMTAAIRDAKVTVNLESYIFKNDKAGEIVAAALIDAARRGIQVRVLVDGTGSSHSGPILDRMRQAGAKVYVFHPLGLWSLYDIGWRTHRKILVVDGTVSFTGGFCIADNWLGNARNPKEWRDMMVRATGPVSAQMQAIFSEDWTYTTGEILAGEKFYPRIAPAGKVEAQAIKVSRGDSSSLAEILYVVAIKSAERSIHIQNAYFVPDEQIRKVLIEAARRGVDVRIMVPGRHIDMPLVRMASRLHYGELLQAGVHILEYNRTMMHQKGAVIDGIFSLVGSINFDGRSLRANAEDSLAFYDRDFAARLDATFADDEKSCREVTYQSWRRRGFEQRLAELVSGLFEPLY